MSLSRWSNSARSFCRHLARVNGAREPHTRSMGPIARDTGVCRPTRDPPRRKLMNEPRRPFREKEIAFRDGFDANSEKLVRCERAAGAQFQGPHPPRAMSDVKRRFLHDGIKSIYEKALECEKWGDVRRSTLPDPLSHPPTRAPRRVPFSPPGPRSHP